MSGLACNRRECTGRLLALPLLGLAPAARALNETEAAAGVRALLDRASRAAVERLGRTDGFFGNPRVRIGPPPSLDAAVRRMRAGGQGRQADALVLAINRVAEAAVAGSSDLLRDVVRAMSVDDALQIVRGHATAATGFFERKTREALGRRLRPQVADAARRQSLAERHDAVVRSAGVAPTAADGLDAHMIDRMLDGLYATMADEEQAIRRDPRATGSALLQEVFGR